MNFTPAQLQRTIGRLYAARDFFLEDEAPQLPAHVVAKVLRDLDSLTAQAKALLYDATLEPAPAVTTPAESTVHA